MIFFFNFDRIMILIKNYEKKYSISIIKFVVEIKLVIKLTIFFLNFVNDLKKNIRVLY